MLPFSIVSLLSETLGRRQQPISKQSFYRRPSLRVACLFVSKQGAILSFYLTRFQSNLFRRQVKTIRNNLPAMPRNIWSTTIFRVGAQFDYNPNNSGCSSTYFLNSSSSFNCSKYIGHFNLLHLGRFLQISEQFIHGLYIINIHKIFGSENGTRTHNRRTKIFRVTITPRSNIISKSFVTYLVTIIIQKNILKIQILKKNFQIFQQEQWGSNP